MFENRWELRQNCGGKQPPEEIQTAQFYELGQRHGTSWGLLGYFLEYFLALAMKEYGMYQKVTNISNFSLLLFTFVPFWYILFHG